jgi:RNA polymerase sigma factor (sigma-70 family)
MSEGTAHQRELIKDDTAQDQLLRLLDPDPQRASEQYHRIFQKLIRFFAAQFCTDPEDLASETIIRACRAISSGLKLTSQFETFIFGVAKNVALEEQRRHRKPLLPLEEIAPKDEPRFDPTENILELPNWKQDLYHKCLEKCLQTLDQQQRAWLFRFYQGDQEGEMKSNRKQLAVGLGISTKALSSRILRLREKLELCIKACVEQREKE